LGDGGRFSWFTSVAPPLIEPIGFGDGLMQLERLLLDHAAEHEAQRDIVVVGIGQGGTMALALAMLWPELVTRIVAIGGFWPVIPGWDMPDRDMAGLQVLLAGAAVGAGERKCALGAEVTGMAAPHHPTLVAGHRPSI
jgi:pimeloyl-ACP methyl ester carboxylesterase